MVISQVAPVSFCSQTHTIVEYSYYTNTYKNFTVCLQIVYKFWEQNVTFFFWEQNETGAT
jgi:hypothetical protein